MYTAWWMIPSLWCIDVAIAALCWGVLIAALFGITMLTFGPLLLLFGLVWSYTLFSRVFRSLEGSMIMHADYYRQHAFPMLLLALCSLAATLWLLFFVVGNVLISFFIIPFIVSIIGRVPFLRKMPYLQELAQAAAYVFACAVPAYYYGFVYTPIGLLYNSHLWCLTCLFFLFNIERESPVSLSEGEQKAAWVPAGLLVLFIPCAYHAFFGDSGGYEQNFYTVLCIGAVALHILSSWRAKCEPSLGFALSWGIMTMPALLGILFFAPETWF